jgi:hypothetical protein
VFTLFSTRGASLGTELGERLGFALGYRTGAAFFVTVGRERVDGVQAKSTNTPTRTSKKRKAEIKLRGDFISREIAKPMPDHRGANRHFVLG